MVGQFQVSDPLFKRELRLEFEDYAIYRARMGDSPVDLSYDRGLGATADLDATLARGSVELNLQYLHRNDDRPECAAGGPRTELTHDLEQGGVRWSLGPVSAFRALDSIAW